MNQTAELNKFLSLTTFECFIDESTENEEKFIPIDYGPLNELFESQFGKEILKIIRLQDEFHSNGQYVIKKEIVYNFIEKLFTYSCPGILKLNSSSQQVYLLFLISNLFYNYNENVLHMDKKEFIDRIYFTNILNICAKHLIQARRLIHRIIKNAYMEVSRLSKDMVEFYAKTYHGDEISIKDDIIYLFLVNLLSKHNPMGLANLESSYLLIFQKIIFFYLKSKTPVNEHNAEISFCNVQTERTRIYEEAIYLAQIQSMCSDSDTINRINKQFNQMKDIILPNELQRLYLFATGSNSGSQKIDLFKIHNDVNRMESIKDKLPQIYRLLRSIHIHSDNTPFFEKDIALIRFTINETLKKKFEKVLSNDVIDPIIYNITNNLLQSLTCGEFIDMVTLTPININVQKFNDQLRTFLEIMLSKLNEQYLN